MIGDEIPGIMHYRHIFDKHPTLTVVLEDYFGDVLEFHTNALSVFDRPGTHVRISRNIVLGEGKCWSPQLLTVLFASPPTS